MLGAKENTVNVAGGARIPWSRRGWLHVPAGTCIHPTYSSWLNQVQPFLSIINNKAIRRGSFRSVKDLTSKIDHFVTHYNQNCEPFIWTATADSIIANPERLCARISGTGN